MTNIDNYDIIGQLFLSKYQNGHIEIRLEIETEATKKSASRQCNLNEACLNLKKLHMEKLSVDLKQAANYLIQMFYITEKKYSCTRTKIGKLLSIVAFSYAREDKIFINEKIYKYDDCGTIINELAAHVDREVYIKCEYDNSKNPFEEQIKDLSSFGDLPPKYQNVDNLTESVKDRIKYIFCKFCAYSPSDLGQCICPIVNCAEIVGENEEIDLSKFLIMTKNNFIIGEYPNDLVEFLF